MKDIIFNWFKTNYNDLYNKMEEVTHNHSNGNKNPYHMEGSVLTHTKMVLDWLDSNDKNLIFACILHDIGKIYTRDEHIDKVHFKKHENISTYLSIDILKHAKKEFEDIDILKIIKLIAWHGTLWIRRNANILDDVTKIIDYKYGHDIEFYQELVEFVEADACGRIYQFKDDEDYILEQFKFLTNYIPYDTTKYLKDKKCEVVMLIGLSGSGKSTYIENNDFKDYEIISVDNILSKSKLNYNSIDYKKNVKKAFDETMKNMLDYIKQEKNVLIDMTNLDKENRRRKLSKFPSTKYYKKAIVFLNGVENINKNLLKRTNKTIPKEVIEKQILTFELPNYDEFDEIEFKLY